MATEPPNLGPAADPLAHVLRLVEMSGVFYCPCELTEPWGASMPAMANTVWFHVLVSGTCRIQTLDGEEVELGVGDLALVPHGAGHSVQGVGPAETPSVLELPHDVVGDNFAVLRYGGGGLATRLVCGGVRLDHPAARHMLAALPPVVHTRVQDRARADWMRATLDLIADETRFVGPGSDVVVSRLCDILVIQAIRAWIDDDPTARTGWLGALRDDSIGAAIAAVHTDPARGWTVADLAAEAAMSRSSFAARFNELVGEPAMSYVTRWRMAVAERALRCENVTVATAAALVGYKSEAAFSRAFQRTTGTSPSSHRLQPLPGTSARRRKRS